MAAISAALHFNEGASGKYCVMDKAEIPPNSLTNEASNRRDSLRLNKAQKRATEKYKRARRATSRVKVRVEEEKIGAEGKTYEAGGFEQYAF